MIFWIFVALLSAFFFYKNMKQGKKAWKILSGLFLVISLLFIVIGLSGNSAQEKENREALKTAKEIVATNASFSEKTLIWYLTDSASHKYSKKAAQYAVDNIGDVWVDEALDIAKEEKENGKSDEEILESLTDENTQFTKLQAEKAIQKLNE
ncbi:TPA: Ltp family lipoprotein [Streptococcus agalactiae]|uniref:Ltp family lipoprotein n=1 Tax=Streptococcus agalactiae TaxID=1311 RepID=UPI0002BB4307|nr:Ltp family lipoprotein [Streptococcus agalactiae]EPT97917.1 hypothetical protein SAG0108_05910 [Streptococcus agalactiae BSU92]CND60275.1 signal peptide [Streptococcus agalactiae]CNI02157.1 signal peptide [Streptococcus agalactiae]